MDLLIICENQLFAECLAHVLDCAELACTFARNRDEALLRLDKQGIGMILLDHAGQSEDSVLEAIGQIHERVGETHILVLNGPTGSQSVASYIEAGAVGFLSRENSIDDVMDAIECVVRYAAKCSDDQAAIVFERLQELARECNRDLGKGAPPLTLREIDVLRLIDMGRSNKEIAAELHLSVHTVKSHVHKILEKAEASNRREAVYLAIHNGWMESPGE